MIYQWVIRDPFQMPRCEGPSAMSTGGGRGQSSEVVFQQQPHVNVNPTTPQEVSQNTTCPAECRGLGMHVRTGLQHGLIQVTVSLNIIRALPYLLDISGNHPMTFRSSIVMKVHPTYSCLLLILPLHKGCNTLCNSICYGW